MKEYIIPIILTILMTGVVLAETSQVDISTMQVGDPDYNQKIDSLSLFDKLRLELKPYTVIGGATCSLYPDFTVDYAPPSAAYKTLCYSNTKYKGVAFQLFQKNPTKFIGEKQVLKGQQGCFNVSYPNTYWYDIYLCDSTAPRACADSDNGKVYDVFGKVTYGVDGVNSQVVDVCDGGSYLLERFCDSDNSVATVSKSCKCLDGRCVADPGSIGGGSNNDSGSDYAMYIISAVLLLIVGLYYLVKK